MLKKMLISSVVMILALCTPAFATIVENEPNDTMGTADSIDVVGTLPWVDTGVVSLGDGTDVDFFKIELEIGNIITASTTPLAILFTDPDTLLGLYDSSGTRLVSSDDDGNGNGSLIMWDITSDGYYYIAVTGSGDGDFNGYDDDVPADPHGQVGDYLLTVSVVSAPEPGTVAIIGIGSLCLVLRRHRKRRTA